MDESLVSEQGPAIEDELTLAISKKSWELVNSLIERHPELAGCRYSNALVNGGEPGGSPFLNVLAEKAPLSCVKTIVTYSDSLETRDENDNTPLVCAMLSHSLDFTGSRLDVIRFLVEEGADKYVRYRDGIPAYLRLSVDFPEDLFEMFFPGSQPLDTPANGVPLVTHFVQAALNKASVESMENLRCLFLDKEAEINPKFEKIEDLPLAAALCRGNLDAADLFMSRGANLDVIDERGRGFGFAVKHPSSVYWLEQKCIELLEQVDDQGMTPLRNLTGTIAKSYTIDEVETVKALIGCGCSLDAIDKNGPHYSSTPRMLIKNSKSEELREFLLSIESCRNIESILREMEGEHRSTFFVKKKLKI